MINVAEGRAATLVADVGRLQNQPVGVTIAREAGTTAAVIRADDTDLCLNEIQANLNEY